MKNKSWFLILFDLAVLILLAWATIHLMNKMDDAKEEIEVVRQGFTAAICMMALVGTGLMQRMESFSGNKS